MKSRLAELGGSYDKLVREELKTAARLFAEDKLFLASGRLLRLVLFLRKEARSSGGTADRKGPDSAVKAVEESAIYKEVASHRQQVELFLSELETDKGWKLTHRGATLTTHWKEPQGQGTTCSFRAAGVVAANCINLCALLLEVDLYPSWFPMMSSAEDFSGDTLSRFHKVARSDMSMPWPFATRECVIEGRGWDALEHRRIVVSSHSIATHPRIRLPAARTDRVRVDISHGGFLLVPLDERRTHVTVMMNMDPHIPIVPAPLVNFFLGKVVNQIHAAMERVAQFQPGCGYIKRMAGNSDLYAYIRHRYKEVLGWWGGCDKNSRTSNDELKTKESRED